MKEKKVDSGKPTRSKEGRNGKNGKSSASSKRITCTDVEHLPEELRKLVDRMLTEGGTFEDTVQAVSELGQERITLGAVEIYFRSNVSLQQARIRRQVETARNLKSALANPESAQSELAEAILLTGLMGVKKRSGAGDMQQAIRAKDQQENYRLKEEAFRLKSEKSALDLRMVRARLKAEGAKLRLVTNRIEQLKRALDRERGGANLSPEMIQRIQEVYGLVSDDSSNSVSG